MKQLISLVQWFIFVIVIPLFVLIIVAGTVLHFSGVDVMDKTKEVAQLLNGSEKIEQIQKVLDETILVLEETNSNENKLQGIIKDKNNEIEELLKENTSLKEQLKSYDDREKLHKDIIKSYESMSPKNAASILSELEKEQRGHAIEIIKGIKPEVLAQILENMEPSIAASLTKGITE